MICKCGKCKNYVYDDWRACRVCGTPVEMKESKPDRVSVYGRSDEDGAVRHIERYSDFWDGYNRVFRSFTEWLRHRKGLCGNYLYIYSYGRGDRCPSGIYKFDLRQYLETRNNHLSAVDLITGDFQKFVEQYEDQSSPLCGVNREGIWYVFETERATKVMLFGEQGELRGKVSVSKGKLEYIYGSKMYFSSEDDSKVAQFDILEKTSKVVWDLRREPFYREFEKISRSRGLGFPKYRTTFGGIVANENYVIVRYGAYGYDERNDWDVYYLETMGVRSSDYDNISCSDLHTGEQTLLDGGAFWHIDDGEFVLDEEVLYGPLVILERKKDSGESVYKEIGRQYKIIGMDLVSNEIYFEWYEVENNEWGNGKWSSRIYSASIRDFQIRKVAENKRLCWDPGYKLESSGESYYFCGEYLYRIHDEEDTFILGRDGSRVDLLPVDCRNSRSMPASILTNGAWICTESGGYKGCFETGKYREIGDEYNLLAINTEPLSGARCLHIKRDEFKKTKEELAAKRDEGGKPCKPGQGGTERKTAGMAGGESLSEFAGWFRGTSGKNVIPPGTERTLIFPEGLFSPENSGGGRVTGTSWNQLFIRLVNEMNIFTDGKYIETRYREEKNTGKQQKFIVDEAFLNEKKSVYLEKYEDGAKALKQWKSWAGQWHAIDGSRYYAMTSYNEQNSVNVLLSECERYLKYLAERLHVRCGVDDLMISFAGGRQHDKG